jgi:hypothetical protein
LHRLGLRKRGLVLATPPHSMRIRRPRRSTARLAGRRHRSSPVRCRTLASQRRNGCCPRSSTACCSDPVSTCTGLLAAAVAWLQSMGPIISSTTSRLGRASRCVVIGSCRGQPTTAIAPRSKLKRSSAIVLTPVWMCGTVLDASDEASPPSRRSSAKSMIDHLKQGNTARGKSRIALPFRIRVFPRLASSRRVSTLAGSVARNTGTSSIMLKLGRALSTSFNKDSDETFDDTAPPPAGQTSTIASSNALASSMVSARTGTTVCLVATLLPVDNRRVPNTTRPSTANRSNSPDACTKSVAGANSCGASLTLQSPVACMDQVVDDRVKPVKRREGSCPSAAGGLEAEWQLSAQDRSRSAAVEGSSCRSYRPRVCRMAHSDLSRGGCSSKYDAPL